jgi:hypothetical protein
MTRKGDGAHRRRHTEQAKLGSPEVPEVNDDCAERRRSVEPTHWLYIFECSCEAGARNGRLDVCDEKRTRPAGSMAAGKPRATRAEILARHERIAEDPERFSSDSRQDAPDLTDILLGSTTETNVEGMGCQGSEWG